MKDSIARYLRPITREGGADDLPFPNSTASGGIVNTSQWASDPERAKYLLLKRYPGATIISHVVRRPASREWLHMLFASRHRESLRNK